MAVNLGASDAALIAGNPVQHEPFRFDSRRTRIDWRLLHGIDISEVYSRIDLDALERVLDVIAHGDLEAEDVRHLSEVNFLKIFRLSQLTIEYLLYVQKTLQLDCEYYKDGHVRACKHVEALRLKCHEYKEHLLLKKKELKRCKKDLDRMDIFAQMFRENRNPNQQTVQPQVVYADSPETVAQVEQLQDQLQRMMEQRQQMQSAISDLAMQLSRLEDAGVPSPIREDRAGSPPASGAWRSPLPHGDEATARVSRLQDENRRLRLQLDQATRRAEQTSVELLEAQAQAKRPPPSRPSAQLEQDLQSLREELQRTHEQLKQERAERTELQRELQESKDKARRLQEQLKDALAEAGARTQPGLGEMVDDEDAAYWETRCKQLQRELEAAKERARDAEREAEMLRDRNAVLSERAARGTRPSEVVSIREAELETEVERLRLEREQLTEDLRSAELVAERLQKDYDDSEREVKRLRSLLAEEGVLDTVGLQQAKSEGRRVLHQKERFERTHGARQDPSSQARSPGSQASSGPPAQPPGKGGTQPVSGQTPTGPQRLGGDDFGPRRDERQREGSSGSLTESRYATAPPHAVGASGQETPEPKQSHEARDQPVRSFGWQSSTETLPAPIHASVGPPQEDEVFEFRESDAALENLTPPKVFAGDLAPEEHEERALSAAGEQVEPFGLSESEESEGSSSPSREPVAASTGASLKPSGLPPIPARVSSRGSVDETPRGVRSAPGAPPGSDGEPPSEPVTKRPLSQSAANIRHELEKPPEESMDESERDILEGKMEQFYEIYNHTASDDEIQDVRATDPITPSSINSAREKHKDAIMDALEMEIQQRFGVDPDAAGLRDEAFVPVMRELMRRRDEVSKRFDGKRLEYIKFMQETIRYHLKDVDDDAQGSTGTPLSSGKTESSGLDDGDDRVLGHSRQQPHRDNTSGESAQSESQLESVTESKSRSVSGRDATGSHASSENQSSTEGEEASSKERFAREDMIQDLSSIDASANVHKHKEPKAQDSPFRQQAEEGTWDTSEDRIEDAWGLGSSGQDASQKATDQLKASIDEVSETSIEEISGFDEEPSLGSMQREVEQSVRRPVAPQVTSNPVISSIDEFDDDDGLEVMELPE
uniref:Zinc finger protein DZIP1 n=1 Tax=Tetraselmis sp. GSL018 TaxID=582737 RepID=A0A061R8F5_9CHLO|eukprot:CAMPEP_0177589618 /NCGR_PEP_ID=MMETSP0419_2-20121207/6918_1 /TAXON_ID=582737 /ORGANISM="Tetraselmis sp., Strain GSL018" /LENGTH=1119 /DNA_ID=CAMNT_0019080021 /DNA_START=575 /DNA_END=3934 /DNA_ORIENTATION=+